MADDIIQVCDLHIGYGTKEVAKRLSFTLNRAEILCLLGPNGAGKSTLFKTLLGLIPGLGGDVRISQSMPVG